MCTVSWLRRTHGYLLYFNRDEQKSRPAALPPAVARGSCRHISSVDPVSGGTWLAVNEWGMTVSILNYYERSGVLPSGKVSRGRIVSALASAGDLEALSDGLKQFDLKEVSPFHLLAVSPVFSLRYTWDGERLSGGFEAENECLLTTSSHRPAEVTSYRRQLYRKMLGGEADPSAAEAYHRSFDPERGALSVCMSREDAQTVSITRVEVTDSEIRYAYMPRSLSGQFEETSNVMLPIRRQ